MKHHPLYRSLEIIKILIKHGLLAPLLTLCFVRPLRGSKLTQQGPQIREALEDLGPLFIKVGQVLSTRFDLLPTALLKELSALQDKVPPFSGVLAQQIVEKALRVPFDQVFKDFDRTALASASIAQVHAATLISTEPVVLKIRRPHIEQQIKRDLRLLKMLARLLAYCSRKIRRFKPLDIIRECEETLVHELDLLREGANASALKRHFKKDSLLYIPKIYWDYSSKHVLVMERVSGIPLLDFDRLAAGNLDRRILAKHLVELFFTQVFRDCFFHADIHPGNLLVASNAPPRYIMMDFGIMGSLSPEDQQYLASNLLAFSTRDYRRVAALHVECGWVPPTTRITDLEGSLRAICEPLLERPRKDVSLGALLSQLFQLANQYQINIQPQLILFQKTLASVEMLSLALDPEIDLWKTAEPLLKKWMRQRMGMKAVLRSLKDQSPAWIQLLPRLPTLLHRLGERTDHRLEQQATRAALGRLAQDQKRLLRLSLVLGLLFAASLCIISLGLHPRF